MLNESDYIKIQKIGSTWYCNLTVGGTGRGSLRPIDKSTLNEYCQKLAKKGGRDINVQNQNKSLRFNTKDKASNKSRIISISQGKLLKGIFDPYFDTRALNNLLTLWKLGVTIENPLKILKTSKTNVDSIFLKDFESETKIIVEIKSCQSKKEHRRFLMFNNCEILIMGMSLNDLDKNEAAHIETSKDDCDFFDQQWKLAK